MKKKRILMGVAAALILTAIGGGSLAFFSATGSKVQQKINTRNLDVAFYEDDTKLPNNEINVKVTTPGEPIKKEVGIVNYGDVPLYARITIKKYWASGDKKLQSADFDKSKIIVGCANLGNSSGNWIKYSEDKEEIVLYYTDPVAAGDRSEIFMDEISISEDLGNDYTGTNVMLSLEVDAVQVYAGTDAILSEWGVAAEMDGEHITGIYD